MMCFSVAVGDAIRIGDTTIYVMNRIGKRSGVRLSVDSEIGPIERIPAYAAKDMQPRQRRSLKPEPPGLKPALRVLGIGAFRPLKQHSVASQPESE